MIKLDELALELLRHCSEGPALVAPICARYPSSSVYRRLKVLIKAGLLEKLGNKYRTMPAGLSLLKNPSAASAEEPPGLVKHIPQLALLPTDLHLALVELVLAAVVARKNELAPSHHLSVILVGPRLTWKTWTASFVALLLGVDPDAAILFLPSESGRSLSFRRDARGKTATKRYTLALPVVALDEYSRCSTDVRQAAHVYLHGTLIVPAEEEKLEVKPVTLVILNPFKETDDLQGKLNMDSARIRRAIVADFSSLKIPEHLLCEGDEILAAVKAQGATELPERECQDLDARRKIQAVLGKIVKEREVLALIDFRALELLVRGFTAWLSAEAAFNRLLWTYATAVETLGWLLPDWRIVLAHELGLVKERTVNPNESTVPQLPMSTANPLDLDHRLAEINEACRELELDPVKVVDVVKRVQELEGLGFTIETARLLSDELADRRLEPEEVAHALADCVERKVKLSVRSGQQAARLREMAKKVAELEARHSQLRKACAERGWSVEKVARLRGIDDALRDGDVSASDVAAACWAAGNLAETLNIDVHRALDLLPDMTLFFARELKGQALEPAEIDAALELLAKSVSEDMALKDLLEADYQELTRLQRKSRELKTQIEERRKKLKASDELAKKLSAERYELDEDIRACKPHLNELLGKIDTLEKRKTRLMAEVRWLEDCVNCGKARGV